MIIKFSKKFSVWGVAAIIFFLINAAPRYSYAQKNGESKYEKIQRDKIKWNKKRLKSQRARRSRSQVGFFNFRPSSAGRRGDQPYQGNSYNYSNRKRISSSSTPAVYAQPDPYAFRSRSSRRSNVYSNDGLKIAPRPPAKAWKGNIAGSPGKRSPGKSRPTIHAQPNPYKHRSGAERGRNVFSNDNLKSGSPSTEKAWKGNIAGSPARRSPGRSKPTIHAQPNPYKHRPGAERGRNVFSNDNLKSGSPPAEKAWKGNIAGSPARRSPGRSKPTIHAQPNPYKHRSGAGRARNVYSNDNLRLGSPPPAKAWKGDIAGNTFQTQRRPGGKINVHPQANPYSHRKMRSEGERISKNQNSYGTSPRSSERPPKRGRIKIQSASGRYTVNRRANPYKLRGQHKWENTYTGGFYGRKEGIRPRNTQRISGAGSANPYKNRGRLGDKPYRGEISGGYETTPRNPQRAWKGDIAGRKLRTKSKPQGVANVHPRVNPYGNRLNRSERDRISRNQDFIGATPRSTERPARKGRVSINTASKAYLVRRKAKPYKLRDVKKWEEVYTGGFYGRREGIMPKNTQRVSSLASPDPYEKRGRMGDKPYRGAISGGGLMSATKKGETAWKGDIAGRRIDYSKPHDNQKSGDRFGRSPHLATASGGLHNNGGRAINTPGGGSISRSMQRNNKGKAILSFAPGKTALKATSSRGKHDLFEIAPGFIDANINYQGDIKSRRPEKGGGSLARNNWNNKGQMLPQRYGSKERITGSYSGNLRSWGPEKGGGSIDRNNWNNKGQMLPQRYGSKERITGSYSGNLRSWRPEKGGGSVNRNNWNNKGRAMPKGLNDKESGVAGRYTGNIRAWDPFPGGGGSTSRNNWNNNGQALPKSYDDGNSRIPGSFSGSLKGSRSDKGGRSITREDAWNNSGSPLPKKSLTSAASKSSRHMGDKKQKKSRLARNQKADDNALMVRKPARTYFASGNFRGSKKVKRKVDGQTHTSTNFFTSKENNNAVEEKKKFISFKLLWNRWFGKSTPENGDKERSPRYDRKEKGLWYE